MDRLVVAHGSLDITVSDIHFRNEIQNMSEKGAFYEKLKSLRRESDRVLFSDGGKHWPIFRVKDDLYNDFWPFFERYIKE